jgi:hypothetical protein
MVRKLILCFSFLLRTLLADWNSDFDLNSQYLIETFPSLQNASYLTYYDFFSRHRESLQADSILKKEIRDSLDIDKFMKVKVRDGLILKKRAENNINELFIWELACLLGGAKFVVPSFPLDIEGKKVILQKMEEFTVGQKKTRVPPDRIVREVDLVDYWEAHYIIFILGLRDMVGCNLGIGNRGRIRLFDAEESFIYNTGPQRTLGGFDIGFVTQALEWSQYREPLTEAQVKRLNAFIHGLSDFEEKLEVYLRYRPLSISKEGIRDRLHKVRAFSLRPGISFRNFYGFIFPKMSKGLEELRGLISSIIGRNVDHGSAIFYAMGKHRIRTINSKQKKAIKDWTMKYVD